MIERASEAIGELSQHERRQREAKYSRRNKMHYIDKLLNELEMLNLAEHNTLPRPLSAAVERLLEDSDLKATWETSPGTVIAAMDVLYEIQDGLMFNDDED